MTKKYRVEIGHLVGHCKGDETTDEKIAEAGGDAVHLVKLGAVSVIKSTTKKGA